MEKRKAYLIINPRDGQNIVKLPDILAVLYAAGYTTRVVLKEYGGHTQELARQAVEEGCDLVLGYGGDGTLNQVVNGVMEADGKSIVGVIPGGTANLWATEIVVPTDNPVKAVLALLNSKSRRVDIGHVAIEKLIFPAGQDGASEERVVTGNGDNSQLSRPHFLLMAGLGLDAVVMQGVSKPLKHKIRELAVGLAAVRELPAYRPFTMEVFDEDHKLLWQGEALQVVIGNTRLYADVLHITPDAYINDGQLDICVITAGDPLGTLQQVFSLLLRHQPDDLTAEYFRGKRLFLRVPVAVGLQLDGSAVKLKDYLNKEQKKALKEDEHTEGVFVEYCFDALPKSLRVAVPQTYDNVLFEESAASTNEQAAEATDQQDKEPLKLYPALSAQEMHPSIAALRAEGRKIKVVAAAFDIQHDTYIVAGTFIQQLTGTPKPVAVCVDSTTLVTQDSGAKLPPTTVLGLAAGREIIVSGKKDKRGVIKAQCVLV